MRESTGPERVSDVLFMGMGRIYVASNPPLLYTLELRHGQLGIHLGASSTVCKGTVRRVIRGARWKRYCFLLGGNRRYQASPYFRSHRAAIAHLSCPLC